MPASRVITSTLFSPKSAKNCSILSIISMNALSRPAPSSVAATGIM